MKFFWSKPRSTPPAPPAVKTADELVAMLPRYRCDRCGHERSGDPYGCEWCPNHYGERVEYRQIAGVKWDEFYPELERHNKARSQRLYELSGRQGWLVHFDAAIARYALVSPDKSTLVANPATGNRQWDWDEIVEFVCQL